MCGRVEHYVAAVGHGAVASLFAFGALPSGALASPAARVAVTVLMAAGTVPMSGGKWSPDIDQFGSWKKIDRLIPDEILLFGGPMRHRGATHWLGFPAAMTVALIMACHRLPAAAAVLLVMLAWVPLAGVWSHLFSDFWIGARYSGGKRPDADDPSGAWDRKSMMDADDHPRGPGIPLMPWWFHVGAGWRVGSGMEWVYVLSMISLGAGALYGSWRGLTLPWSTPAAIGALVVLLLIGFAGRAKGARRSPAPARAFAR